jgi:hypothetical protein
MPRLLAVIATLLALAGSAWAQATMRASPVTETGEADGRGQPGDRAAARLAPIDIDLPVVVEQGRIVVRAERGLARKAHQIAERADLELRVIADDLRGLPVPPIAEIRLVVEAADMARAAPPGGRPPAWAAGVAYPSAGVVVVAMQRSGQPLDVDGTVDHELAHLALGAALGPSAPRWLHEGFAYLHSTDWSWQRTQTLAGMAWFGNVIPLDDLEHGFPAEELPASRAYAEAYDFVAYLAHRGRWQEASDDGDRFAFQQFLAYTARTGDVDAAAQQAFGRPLQDLFDEWEATLRDRFMFLPIGLFLLALWLFAAVLLVLGWRRRRRQNAARLAEWARIEREAEERRRTDPDRGPRLVPAVPVWSGPLWAPPGAAVSEPPEEDVDAVLDDDDDARPPPPPRRPPPGGRPN